MRRWKLAIVALSLLLPGPALAWGPEGHEVVAHLAARNLTAKARAQVAALLGGEAEAAMAIAANWADEIRDDRPQTSSWHFVNIEIDRGLDYDAARDCRGGNCVVQQISRVEAVLKSWAQIFASGQRLKIEVSHQVVLTGMMLTVHSVQENIAVRGAGRQSAPVVATNAFLRTVNGWRMIVHHASPAPAVVQETPRAQASSGPKVLH